MRAHTCECKRALVRVDLSWSVTKKIGRVRASAHKGLLAIHECMCTQGHERVDDE